MTDTTPTRLQKSGKQAPKAAESSKKTSGNRDTMQALPAPSGESDLEHTLEALSVDHITAERLRALPRDVGWLLVTAGLVGVVMPGVIGVPFLVLGGLILTPATNRRAEHWLSGHAPGIFKGSVRQINRFLDDLERRYPRNPGS